MLKAFRLFLTGAQKVNDVEKGSRSNEKNERGMIGVTGDLVVGKI